MIALSYNILLPRSNYSGGQSHPKEVVGARKLNLQYFPKTPLHIKEVQIVKTKDTHIEKQTILLGPGTENAICIIWHGGNRLRWDLYFIADGSIKFNSLQSL